MPTYVFACPTHGRVEVARPMDEAHLPEVCKRCFGEAYDFARRRGHPSPATAATNTVAPMRRVFTVPHRAIIRPSGYRLSPDDPKFGDFRREMELGELKDDPTPVKFTPSELAAFDHIDVTVPDDPERDRQLAQLVHQHWTNDLSDDTVRRRELASQAAKEGRL